MGEALTYEALKQRVQVLEQTESKLAYAEKKSRAWLENSPVCTKILDLDFNLQYMSSAGIESLKVSDVTQFYGKPYPFDFYPASFKNCMTNNLEKAVKTNEVITQEAHVVDVEGNELWFHSTIVPVSDDEGRIEYIIVVSIETTVRKQVELKLAQYNENLESMVKSRTIALSREITERKKIEDKITHIATHDPLTGLPNRYLLIDRLNQACAWARRDQTKVAVLFIDLDGFKPINDELGHMIGDQILREMAERMSSCLRETDTVARFGGDEFVVVMTDVKNTANVSTMAENLCRSLRKAITLNSVKTALGASIGIALYPDHGKTYNDLLHMADAAMYQVKKSNKNDYVFSVLPS